MADAPPTFETLTVAVDDGGTGIGRLTLNRPDRLNPLSGTALRELPEAARWFDTRFDVRVVVVSGSGRAFSAGADLRDSPLRGANPDGGVGWAERREIGQLGRRMADALEAMRAVTIAKVHGVAVGGGLVVMLACDLRVVATGTVMSIPEVDLGIPLAWGGIPRLVREIGPAMTKELVMTCRRFTPEEAHALGMVNRVVALDRLDAEVESLAAEVAAKPAAPIVVTKEHVNAVATAMGAGLTAFADGDVLLGTAFDPASQDAARTYSERVFGPR